MIEISATNDTFKINDTAFSFPIDIQSLQNVIGEARYTKTKYNHIYTWDELGIFAGSKNGKLVESLMVCMVVRDYAYMPRQVFPGCLTFNSEEAVRYYSENKNKRVKLFKGDKSGAVVTSAVSYWYDIDDGVISAIQIQAHNPEEHKVHIPLPISEKHKHLQSLWDTWIEEINNIIPDDNEYYNLDHGITEDDIKTHAQLDEEISIPGELIDFYKIRNVIYDPVTSAFGFSPCGVGQYDLIPFQDIKREWDDIQSLQFGDDIEADSLDDYSELVSADDYANPKWVPFASDRNGDYLLYDTDPSSKGVYGQIIELQNESWERNVVADSLKALMQDEIDLLKAGDIKKYDFILGK